jgi:DnaJ-domain-containing protein 1
MSLDEIIITIAGLLFGYWIIGLFNIENSKNTNNEETDLNNGFSEDQWFNILEVSENEGISGIKKAYLKMIARYHPDKVESLGVEFKEIAHKKTLAINKAYNEVKKIKNFN